MRKISLFLLLLTFFSCTKDQQFKVTVNINPTQGGSVAPPSGDYDDGDTVNFIATATYTLVVANPFITTWRTTADDESITIPAYSSLSLTYNYTVDWGDGNVSEGVTGDVTHQYAKAGDYNVSITGTFPRIYFNYDAGDREKIIDIVQWGNIAWTSFENAFAKATNLNVSATDAPDLSQVTNMSRMFHRATSLGSPDLSSWDTSTITNMESVFAETPSFNGNISTWNVSGVISLSETFSGAVAFNQDLSSWNVSIVWDMLSMFDSNATNFSAANYDKLLAGWSQLRLESDVAFTAPPTYYCNVAARNILVNDFNWTISGDTEGTNTQCNPTP